MNLKKGNDELTRDRVISEMSSDLADTEIEKFKELTQDVDFGNEEDFKGKLDTLKESYFPKVKKETTENIDNVETEFLPINHNWITSHLLPIYDEKNKTFKEPNIPNVLICD